MIERLQLLRVKRAEFDAAKRHYDEMYRRFVDSAKEMFDEQARLKADVDMIEGDIRIEALAQYEASGLKEFEGGVRIRIVKDIEITNMDEALAWGIEHKMAIVPDVKALKEMSRIHEMPFMRTVERAQATIPKDIVILGEARL